MPRTSLIKAELADLDTPVMAELPMQPYTQAQPQSQAQPQLIGMSGKHNSPSRRRGLLRFLLLALMLISLTLLLSACAYPGKGDCRGVGNGSDPTTGVSNCVTSPPRTDNYQNQIEGGPWYIQWILEALKTLLVSLSSAAINVATAIFAAVFNSTASLDFAGCSAAYGPPNPLLGQDSITCVAHNTWWTVVSVAGISLLPLLAFWKIFTSTMVGAVLEEFRESLWVVVPKLIITVLVLYYLNLLYTSIFGLSEMFFDLILGGEGHRTVYDIGTQVQATVATLNGVNNLGMLALLTLLSLVVALIFVILGLAFFVRTILIILMYILSGPAVVAAASDEFRPWFFRWWSSVQALLISPIPVSACLLLVMKATSLVANSSDVERGPFQAATDPYQFATYMIYVACFLVAAAWFLIALTAQSGRVAFGALRAGVKAVGLGIGAAVVGTGLAAAGGVKLARAAGKAFPEGSSGSSKSGNVPIGGFEAGGEGGVPNGFPPPPVYTPPTVQTGYSELGQSMRGVQVSLQEMARIGANPPPLLPPPLAPLPANWSRNSYERQPLQLRTAEGSGASASAEFYSVRVENAPVTRNEPEPPTVTPPPVSEASYRHISESEIRESFNDPYHGARVQYDPPESAGTPRQAGRVLPETGSKSDEPISEPPKEGEEKEAEE